VRGCAQTRNRLGVLYARYGLSAEAAAEFTCLDQQGSEAAWTAAMHGGPLGARPGDQSLRPVSLMMW
jgi:hypothetical protein